MKKIMILIVIMGMAHSESLDNCNENEILNLGTGKCELMSEQKVSLNLKWKEFYRS